MLDPAFAFDSKILVRDVLKSARLKDTPFSVFVSKEVQACRKQLIPKMKEAREAGNTAYLVRDKLYINNVLLPRSPPYYIRTYQSCLGMLKD
jgi:hypothetical protein